MRFFSPDAKKLSKNEPKHARLRKKRKEKSFHGAIFVGPSGGTKKETAKSQNQLPLADPCSKQQKSQLLLFKELGCSFLNGGGPHMRSLIPSDFPALKMEPQTNMRYQLFPFSGPTVASAMQHHPGNIHQFATPNQFATPIYTFFR